MALVSREFVELLGRLACSGVASSAHLLVRTRPEGVCQSVASWNGGEWRRGAQQALLPLNELGGLGRVDVSYCVVDGAAVFTAIMTRVITAATIALSRTEVGVIERRILFGRIVGGQEAKANVFPREKLGRKCVFRTLSIS